MSSSENEIASAEKLVLHKPVPIKSGSTSPSGSASPVSSNQGGEQHQIHSIPTNTNTTTASPLTSGNGNGNGNGKGNDNVNVSVRTIFPENGAVTNSNNIGRVTHPKISAFMNWIPMDRTSGYMSSVFRNLRISDLASVAMNKAFDRKSSTQPQLYPRKERPPHNIAYITIPANSILDTEQGKMFLKGIQSEEYQIILDCGDEAGLTPWQYRAYPVKKKLNHNEVPSYPLPRLGIMKISLQDAKVVENYDPNEAQFQNSAQFQVSNEHGKANAYVMSSVDDKVSDDLSSINPVASNVIICGSNEFNDHSVSDVRLVDTLRATMKSNTTTFANVVQRGTSDNNINTQDSTSSHGDTAVGIPKQVHVSNWAESSTDPADDSTIVASEEKEEKSTTDKSHHNTFHTDKMKLNNDLLELHNKAIANVVEKEEECMRAHAVWKAAKVACNQAKMEKSRYEKILNMFEEEFSSSVDAAAADNDDCELKELLLQNTNSSTPRYQNKQYGNKEVDGYINDAQSNYSSTSGHVTPLVFYCTNPNSEGGGGFCWSPYPQDSPQPQMWAAAPHAYGPPSVQYEVPTTPTSQSSIPYHGGKGTYATKE